MAIGTLEKELLESERQYWQAIQERDGETAERLTDEECFVMSAQGVSRVRRDTIAEMVKSPKCILNHYRFDGDTQARMLSDNVAVISYMVHSELMVEGKPVQVKAADSSVWVRREGRWVCALHAESLLGDPYGRDRRPDS